MVKKQELPSHFLSPPALVSLREMSYNTDSPLGKEKAMQNKKLPHDHGEGEKTALIREQLDRVEDFQIVAEVFKQLGDTTRIRIFWLLCHCEECVLNISAMLGMSSPAVSHHLRPLKNSGLIVSRRSGKEVYYKAADTKESRLLHQMIEQVMEITCVM